MTLRRLFQTIDNHFAVAHGCAKLANDHFCREETSLVESFGGENSLANDIAIVADVSLSALATGCVAQTTCSLVLESFWKEAISL
jgi:hypothetical protein